MQLLNLHNSGNMPFELKETSDTEVYSLMSSVFYWDVAFITKANLKILQLLW